MSCQAGLLNCGGVCVNTDTDRDNCGQCGDTCADTEVCDGGTCKAICEPGSQLCQGFCSDPFSDPQNCGGCGIQCALNGACFQGICRCMFSGVVCQAPSTCAALGACQ